MHRRGKAYLALGNYEEAIQDFQDVMQIEPNNTEVYSILKNPMNRLILI
jgi:Flp pilus assembly protein TadD